MAVLDLVSLSPADRVAGDRQHTLNCRMQLLACISLLAFAGVAVGTIAAYELHGLAAALIWLVASTGSMLAGLRWADRIFIEPLQACCQADFNRHVEMLFGSLLEPINIRR